MSFRWKNIYRYPKTTYIGLLILLLLSMFIISGKATYVEVGPALLIVIGFLLHGKKKNQIK